VACVARHKVQSLSQIIYLLHSLAKLIDDLVLNVSRKEGVRAFHGSPLKSHLYPLTLLEVGIHDQLVDIVGI
jgi:hypothetical protein